MCLWQRVVKGRLEFGNLLSVWLAFSRHPVGDQGFSAAQTQPLIEQTAITQAFDRDQFMVALQEYRLMRLSMFDQSIDRFAGRWTAIDIITQKNVNRSHRRAERDIGVDPSQQYVEQIQATMNVADGIDPQTCRQRWTSPLHSEFLKARKRGSHSSTRHCRTDSISREHPFDPHYKLVAGAAHQIHYPGLTIPAFDGAALVLLPAVEDYAN